MSPTYYHCNIYCTLKLTNNLQKKLNEVRREKEALEKCNPMSKAELEARLAALRKGPGGADIDMSEALEEGDEEEEEENEAEETKEEHTIMQDSE